MKAPIKSKVLWSSSIAVLSAGLVHQFAHQSAAHPAAPLLATPFSMTDNAPLKTAPPSREVRLLTKATQSFLTTLSAEQRAAIVLPFDSQERFHWNYVPAERRGLSFKQMNPLQRAAALQLLRVGLSAAGFAKTETIRALEPVLAALENNSPTRDSEKYYFTLFGAPASTPTWALRYEGHHVSFNWTVSGGQVIADSPQFLGANPARVLEGPQKGTRALAAEEDLGRAFVLSLDAAQQKEAILMGAAPADILTGTQRRAAIQNDEGIAYRHLNARQRAALIALIEEHAAAQPPALARRRLKRIKSAGLDKVKFAWMGGLLPGEGHYYRVQGPTFLIEYDNTQNNANHVHTVWRDFQKDFGADVLGEHLEAVPHTHEP